MEELKTLVSVLAEDMRRNTEEVIGLRAEQRQVLDEHVALRRANRRERRWRRVSVALVIAALAGGFWLNHNANRDTRRVAQQQAKDLQCIAAHEDQQDDRSTVITAAANARNKALRLMVDAQYKALTYARTKNPVTATLVRLVDDWNAKTEAFRKADDAYVKATVDNPVPQLVFSCSDRLNPHTGPTPTVTRTASATRSVTSTVTHVVPAPTTVQMPGATRTVVIREPRATRTVTTTKAPPNCITHPALPCTLTIPARKAG